jgi:ABC-2 type transport system ATP-binding protein
MGGDSAPVIETRHLGKRYGKTWVVREVTMAVAAGEIIGLLGPNGAGKTTTILMLLGLTEPSSGSVRVLGLDPARRPLSVKRRVGYLPDRVGFYDELSGRENLVYTARLNGLASPVFSPRIEAALMRMGLADVAHHRVATYSRGMRQRLGLAELLVKAPQVAILDEPTLGLDPEAADSFLSLVRGLRAEGMTVLISSHLLHQVQAVCDRVALFHRGQLALMDSVPALARRVLGAQWCLEVAIDGDPARTRTVLAALPEVHVEPLTPNHYVLRATRDVRPQLMASLAAAGLGLAVLIPKTPDLDEIYRRYFQDENRDGQT